MDLTKEFKKNQEKALKENPDIRKKLKRNSDNQAGKSDLWRNKNQVKYNRGYDLINWNSKNKGN